MGLNDILIRKALGNAITKLVRDKMDKDNRAKSSVKVNQLEMDRDKENMVHVRLNIELIADEKNINDLIDKLL